MEFLLDGSTQPYQMYIDFEGLQYTQESYSLHM